MKKKDQEYIEEEKRLWDKVTGTIKKLKSDRYSEYVTSEDFSYNKNIPKENIKNQTTKNKIKSRLSIEDDLNSKKSSNVPADLRENKYSGIDLSTAKKILKGKIVIEEKLDLHGFNQKEAFQILKSFIEKSSYKGFRNVQVITGKGKHGDGILKRNVPIWLKTKPLSDLIIAISDSVISDGGEGALYVRLKNRKK